MRHAELAELLRRRKLYALHINHVDVEGQTVIVVDDGLATGTTMRAAVQVLRGRRPESLVVAVPVGSRQAVEALLSEAVKVVCLHDPANFAAVGDYYDDFTQVTDAEVMRLLRQCAPRCLGGYDVGSC